MVMAAFNVSATENKIWVWDTTWKDLAHYVTWVWQRAKPDTRLFRGALVVHLIKSGAVHTVLTLCPGRPFEENQQVLDLSGNIIPAVINQRAVEHRWYRNAVESFFFFFNLPNNPLTENVYMKSPTSDCWWVRSSLRIGDDTGWSAGRAVHFALTRDNMERSRPYFEWIA